MTKHKKNKSSSSRTTDDDQALWQTVAETLTPIRVKGRYFPSQDFQRQRSALASEGMRPPTPVSEPHPAKSQTISPSRQSVPEQSIKQSPKTAKPSGLAMNDTRRLRSGRTKIEARLDLHGMRQAEAHVALKHFLLSAQHRGLRWVLVITGKGGEQRTYDQSHFDGSGRTAAPGVLRRNVPRWLSEPDLRTIVIGYEESAPQHGGAGALYINLRRRSRS